MALYRLKMAPHLAPHLWNRAREGCCSRNPRSAAIQRFACPDRRTGAVQTLRLWSPKTSVPGCWRYRGLMQIATRLRATRANPPGMASPEGPRRDTYAAALQQFDDLMTAAAVIGPVSRPLPLYYAVLQVGKAIAAAWTPGDDWSVRGHGLAEDDRAEWPDALHFRVKPTISQKSGTGVFGAVAEKLGSARLVESVELGALWSALPGANLPQGYGSWPLALPFQPTYFEPGRDSTIRALRGYFYLRGQASASDAESINRLLTGYPDAAGAHLEAGEVILPAPREAKSRTLADAWGIGVGLTWEQPSPELVPPYPHARLRGDRPGGEHWLVPEVGSRSGRLSPLLLWWALLFGLSLLARYYPAGWRAALDFDRSACADGLAELLDEALVIVPELLFDAAAVE